MSQHNNSHYLESTSPNDESQAARDQRPQAEELHSLLSTSSRSPSRESSSSNDYHAPMPKERQFQQQQQKEEEEEGGGGEPYSLHAQPPNASFRYRTRAIWLLVIYLPVLIVPWVLTSIMMFRPIMKPAYVNQVGKYSPRDIWHMERWRTAVNILNGVASVLAVPTVSALLGYGAVIYTQLRKSTKDDHHDGNEQECKEGGEKMRKTAKGLNLGQMFALADKGWSDIGVLQKALFSGGEGKVGSKYLWYGVILVLLAAIQPPLRQVLVQDETITVVTCNDEPILITNNDTTCDTLGLDSKIVGNDPEPQLLAQCRQNIVLQRTLNQIIDVRSNDVQLHLWPETDNFFSHNDQQKSSFGYYFPGSGFGDGGSFFVSSIVNGTTTGVLRQHAARLDTNVTCTLDDNFPSTCPGRRPFTTNFTSSVLDAKICAEGSYDEVPWKNTRDAQNITERLWLHMSTRPNSAVQSLTYDSIQSAVNFTMRCDSTSTRGWFELGNYQNGFIHQPMLEIWPDDEVMITQYNDFSGNLSGKYWPVREEPYEREDYHDLTLNSDATYSFPTPGPLTTAALALFGNDTLLHAARSASSKTERIQTIKSICQYARMPFYVYTGGQGSLTSYCSTVKNVPFTSLDTNDTDLSAIYISEFVAVLMQLFHEPRAARQYLEIAAFFANEALLSTTADRAVQPRQIFTSAGDVILKPGRSIAGLVVISTLMMLQVLGLLLLARFIYSVPSWTISLDASALAKIGAQLQRQGRRLDDLSGVSGRVGVGQRHVLLREEESADGNTQKWETINILGLGESGVISRASTKLEFGHIRNPYQS
ncbi:hypothetical protein BJX64DRAFT_116180 [Aspergillus heterothallicus]